MKAVAGAGRRLRGVVAGRCGGGGVDYGGLWRCKSLSGVNCLEPGLLLRTAWQPANPYCFDVLERNFSFMVGWEGRMYGWGGRGCRVGVGGGDFRLCCMPLQSRVLLCEVRIRSSSPLYGWLCRLREE